MINSTRRLSPDYDLNETTLLPMCKKGDSSQNSIIPSLFFIKGVFSSTLYRNLSYIYLNSTSGTGIAWTDQLKKWVDRAPDKSKGEVPMSFRQGGLLATDTTLIVLRC